MEITQHISMPYKARGGPLRRVGITDGDLSLIVRDNYEKSEAFTWVHYKNIRLLSNHRVFLLLTLPMITSLMVLLSLKLSLHCFGANLFCCLLSYILRFQIFFLALSYLTHFTSRSSLSRSLPFILLIASWAIFKSSNLTKTKFICVIPHLPRHICIANLSQWLESFFEVLVVQIWFNVIRKYYVEALL